MLFVFLLCFGTSLVRWNVRGSNQNKSERWGAPAGTPARGSHKLMIRTSFRGVLVGVGTCIYARVVFFVRRGEEKLERAVSASNLPLPPAV